VRKKKAPIVLKNILVTDYAAEGKSLARVDGKVIFIEKVVPGDVVDIKLSKSKKDFAEGFPINFIEYSKDREQPFCQHFGVCGGCIWQMLPYEKQLQYKHQQVVDNLQRIAKVESLLLPVARNRSEAACPSELDIKKAREFKNSRANPTIIHQRLMTRR
jgi:23S rRNA (uracil1939-C5)-methyltransferase